MLQKNPLFLKIDLTSNSPQIKETSSKQASKQTTSNHPSLFLQPAQFQSKHSGLDRNLGHTPTKSLSNLGVKSLLKEASINSRVTDSSHSPAYKKGLILKTESSQQSQKDFQLQTKASTVKSFVKDTNNKYYYQIDHQKQRSQNSGSITPKSRQSSQISPICKNDRGNYKSENQYKKDDMNLRIKIFIRVKPSDIPQNDQFKIINNKQIVINQNDDMVRKFEFNHVLENVSQQQIYNQTSKLMIDRAICQKGNGIIFTYGQTGSGKTYTMGLLQSIESPEQGLVSLGLHDIFDQLRSKLLEGHIQSYKIELSFIQIYLEEVSDLLNPEAGKLQIREHKDTQKPYVQGVIQVEILNVEEGYNLIGAGIRHRVVASQSLNQNSSRSHTLLIFTIHQTVLDDNNQETQTENKVTFVDLAGSERIKKSNSKGIRIEEAKAINSSLSSLGNVIQALGNPNSSHIPFRDSKLTRILQAYMDGESSVSLICTVNQQWDNTGESLSTLMFAQRCKDVVLRTNLQSSQVIMTTSNNSNPSTEKETDYLRQIKQLEDQIKQMSDSSKTTQDYMTKKSLDDENQQSLVSYLIKIIFKVKQFTQTLNENDSAIRDKKHMKIQLENDIRQQGYEKCGSEEESKLIDEYMEGILQIQANFKSSKSINDIDYDQILQQQKNEIITTIQFDIHQIQQQIKIQSDLLFQQLLNQLSILDSGNINKQWERYVAFLVTQGVIKENSRINTNQTQIEKQLRSKQYMNNLINKAQELFSIKLDLGERIFAKNKIKSRLNLQQEASFLTTVKNLREYSNNMNQIPSNLNGLSTKNYMIDILQREKDKIPNDEILLSNNKLPQIYSSPQEQTNVSFLMFNKKQQGNLFNDISSLDNDRSEHFDNSKSNILELNSFQAQNFSKHLEMVNQVDEQQSKSKQLNYPLLINVFQDSFRKEEEIQEIQEITPKNQKLQQNQQSFHQIKQNDQFQKQDQSKDVQSMKDISELNMNDTIEENKKLSKNLAILRNQLYKIDCQDQLTQDRIGTSTIQTLAGRQSSKQNSREIV